MPKPIDLSSDFIKHLIDYFISIKLFKARKIIKINQANVQNTLF